MGLKQNSAIHRFLRAFVNTNLELWESDGTPTEVGPKKAALVVDTTNGILYINTGTLASPVYNNVQGVIAGEIVLATGSILLGAAGVAAALDAKTSGQILVGNGTTLASVAVSGDATLSSAGALTIGSGAVTLAKIATAAKPILHTVAAGIFTTAGGDANESITAAGVLGTDTAIVWVQKAGATPRTVDTITPGTGSIAVVLSGDPSTDHKLGYTVYRAAA